MPNLVSSDVSQLYTIPASDWVVINKRVGTVLAAAPIQNFITTYLQSYPALLADSRQWQQSTFAGLITQAGLLANYAAKAITNFGTLNTAVKQIANPAGPVPENLKQQTASLLQQLNQDTASLAVSFNTLAQQVLLFLNDNTAVDAQMATHKDQLDIYWEPLHNYIVSLESAVGLVTGEWAAITSDLKEVLVSPVEVTMPFIESLNLEAAIVGWQAIQAEATAFPSTVAGQQQYWTNPF